VAFYDQKQKLYQTLSAKISDDFYLHLNITPWKSLNAVLRMIYICFLANQAIHGVKFLQNAWPQRTDDLTQVI
jgi:hypothetical protein